jgi:hypothetical protein
MGYIFAYLLYAVLQAWWAADVCLKARQIRRDEYPLALGVNFVLAPIISGWCLWCMFQNWRDSWK